MTKINIALGMTQDWVQYSQVTIASVLDNASKDDDYKFYIMSDNFTDEVKECFIKLSKIKDCEFIFLKMNEEDFEGAIHDWLGISSSYRLKLSSITNEEKILYLDSDTIVLQDIAELYNHDVTNYYLAGVEDKMGKYMKKRVMLEDGKKFINGGVQLINLNKLREDSVEEKMFEKLREIMFYTDQDVVNDICRDKILYLPLKYNFMPTAIYEGREEEAENCLKCPFILHFPAKPWIHNKIDGFEHWNKYKLIVENL